MPSHHNLLSMLLVAALPACFVRSDYTFTEKRCLPPDASQRQCRSADDVHSSEFGSTGDDDEIIDIGGSTREAQYSYQCTYPVSVRGKNGLEHTTMTISTTSKICPLPYAAAPYLKATRNDVTLVSVDAAGTLETTTVAQCCYLVTYRSNSFD